MEPKSLARKPPLIGDRIMLMGTRRETTLIRQTTTLDEVTLHVTTRKIGNDEWDLSIENNLRIQSNWMETFVSAEAALDAGFEAIETEGVEEFSSIEGFEYLLDR